MQLPFLPILILLPMCGAIIGAILPRGAARGWALIVALATFVVSVRYGPEASAAVQAFAQASPACSLQQHAQDKEQQEKVAGREDDARDARKKCEIHSAFDRTRT